MIYVKNAILNNFYTLFFMYQRCFYWIRGQVFFFWKRRLFLKYSLFTEKKKSVDARQVVDARRIVNGVRGNYVATAAFWIDKDVHICNLQEANFVSEDRANHESTLPHSLKLKKLFSESLFPPPPLSLLSLIVLFPAIRFSFLRKVSDNSLAVIFASGNLDNIKLCSDKGSLYNYS